MPRNTNRRTVTGSTRVISTEGIATMAGRPKGKQTTSKLGEDKLAGVHAKPSGGRRPRAAGESAADGVGGERRGATSTDPTGCIVIHGEPVSTFDPDLVAGDASTTPDLDAREARQRTTRRPKGPERKPTKDAVADSPPAASPPPSDPS